MKAIRILIVEPWDVLSEAFRSLLQTQPDFEVVGQARCGRQAAEAAEAAAPDVVLLELALPDTCGVKAIARLRAAHPAGRVVVLTHHDEEARMRAALAAGASGYVVKQGVAAELFAAVRAAAKHRIVVDLHGGRFRADAGVGEAAGGTPRLSDRETNVLRLVASGYSNQQAADRLEISVKTVETYRRRVGLKIGLRSRADFVRYAVEAGLLHDNWHASTN